MYVDVVACKRERIKVDVTLAKRSAGRAEHKRISIPVKKAAAPEAAFEDTADIIETIDIVDEPAEELTEDITEEAAETTEADAAELNAECEQELESVMELLSLAGDDSDDAVFSVPTDIFDSESTPDEELSAIDELLAGTDDDVSEEDFDELVADALGELDDMNRRADDMRERLDDQLAQALEEISGSADEESEELTSTIGKELETLESVLSQREEAAASAAEPPEADIPHPAEGSAYMRYFDRDTHGGRVEVSRDVATGQEVVCYDEASGKLSRVCGIIKKDGDSSEN